MQHVRSTIIAMALLVFMSAYCSLAFGQAQSPQQILNQYMADLQKNPGDFALREKIIRHVQTMKQKPLIPLEAEKFEGRAEFAVRNAKSQSDFLDAAKEYEKALLIAPWVPAYYFNQGIAFEKAGKLKEAKRSFEFYLLAVPNAQDARDVRKRIAGLEYAIEKLAKESSPAAMAEKKRQEEGAFLKKIDGARYKYRYSDSRDEGYWIFDIRGNQVITGFILTYSRFSPEDVGRYQRFGDIAPLNDREFALPRDGYYCNFREPNAVEKGRISDDGESITTQITTQKCIETRIYRRER